MAKVFIISMLPLEVPGSGDQAVIGALPTLHGYISNHALDNWLSGVGGPPSLGVAGALMLVLSSLEG